MARNDYDYMIDGAENTESAEAVSKRFEKRGLGKRIIMGFGVTMGIVSSLICMVPNSRSGEAAIAVIDEQNIEQAIETAIKTAEILTTEQKELLLMILNAKNLDASILNKWINGMQNKTQVWDEQNNALEGMLKKNGSIESVWTGRLGDLEDVLNGNMTIYTAVQNDMNRAKVKDETAKSAAEVARLTVTEMESEQKEIMEILKKLDEAEGEKQALQSIGHIEAKQAITGFKNSNLLAQQVVMEAAHYKSDLQREAEDMAIAKNSAESMKKFISSMPDSARH